MKKLFNYALIAVMCVAFFSASTAYGQEWSKEQKAVWQEVEDGWEAWSKGDLDNMFKGFHDSYLGWNGDDPLPITMEKWKSTMERWNDYTTVQYYDIQPARIVVADDNAVVYYFFSFSMIYEKGDKKKEKYNEGRNVEFYVKDGGKWLLLGDMSYMEDDDDD